MSTAHHKNRAPIRGQGFSLLEMMMLLTLNVLAATITQPKTKAPVRDRRYKL